MQLILLFFNMSTSWSYFQLHVTETQFKVTKENKRESVHIIENFSVLLASGMARSGLCVSLSICQFCFPLCVLHSKADFLQQPGKRLT